MILGYSLAEGAYNPKDPQLENQTEYLEWLKFGAKSGVATAQVTLGMMYLYGDGVSNNYSEAAKLLSMAANQQGKWAKSNISVHVAQSLLGDMYQSGKGVEQDLDKAATLYRSAADQGYADAQYKMGAAFARGRGVPQDYSESVAYYRMAAEQGERTAQGALGAMYFLGRGVPQDYVQAHLWSNLASVDGDEKLLKLRDRIEQKMTPPQIAEAQRLAREWKPKTTN